MQVTRYVTPINPTADINGLNVRTDINAIFAAVRDDNAGPTAPANPVPGMRWRDTSVNPAALRIRNDANTAWDDFRESVGGPGGIGMLPIGVPIPLWTHIPGCPLPSNAGSTKFIRLTAGLTGAGQYNAGLLGAESVSGTAPAITATATILVGPMAGQSVPLINTEQSFLRARTTSGLLQASQTQNHAHRTAFGFDNTGAYAWLDSNNTPAFGSDVLTGAGYLNVASSGTAGGNIRIAYTENALINASGETAPRSRSAEFFLRIA